MTQVAATSDQLTSSPTSPLQILIACNWLTAKEAADPRLSVVDRSSSHSLSHVRTADGREAMVKQAVPASVASGRSLARECFVYRLAAWIPELAAALPLPLFIDEAHHVVVLTPLHDDDFNDGGMQQVRRRALEAGWISAALGRTMAGWHRSTQTLLLWPSPATGILRMTDALAFATAGRATQTQALMHAISADTTLADALREARDRWRDCCLIHSDIRRENVVRDTRSKPHVLKVLDWELAGSGDPAWDVASVLADATLDGIRHRSAEPSVFVWSNRAAGGLKQFLHGYSAHGGLIDFRSHSERERVALLTAARLLHVACEWADVQPAGDLAPCRSIVEHARRFIAERAVVTELLRKWTKA